MPIAAYFLLLLLPVVLVSAFRALGSSVILGSNTEKANVSVRLGTNDYMPVTIMICETDVDVLLLCDNN